MKFDQWEGFEKGDWESEINVRDFIQKNLHHMKEIVLF